MVELQAKDVKLIALTERVEKLEAQILELGRQTEEATKNNKKIGEDVFDIRELILLRIIKLEGIHVQFARMVTNRIDRHTDEIEYMMGRRKVGAKQSQRLKKLDKILISRKNQAITFAEAGKLLELGSHNGGKNTRRQAMTKFAKILELKNYEVFFSKTQSGKMIKLTPNYYKHLLMEAEMV